MEYQDLLNKLSKDPYLTNCCYLTNNRFAYQYDLTGVFPMGESKHYNFVPTYDPWCLYCNYKGCKLRCSGCKFVYFCNQECQKKAWPLHKQHCKRDLFTLCINCGSDNIKMQCDNCPVKYCSIDCKNKIEIPHKDYDDCKIFSIKK